MSLLLQARHHNLKRHPTLNSPALLKGRSLSGSKRARSPEHGDPHAPQPIQKRARSGAASIKAGSHASVPARALQKEKKLSEKEEREVEFREKYTRAFPDFRFYFDEDIDKELCRNFRVRIEAMSSKVVLDLHRSKEATHVITNKRAVKPPSVISQSHGDKENANSAGLSRHKSSSQGTFRAPDTSNEHDSLKIAASRNLKVWNADKLESVLSRCEAVPPPPKRPTPSRPPLRQRPTQPQRNVVLSRLLENEKKFGTSERDPNERRNDFHYFSPGSHFVLLEDIYQELATIATQEYPAVKDKDARKPWPVLYCHPKAKNPFTPFDDKEKRRWERQQLAEKQEEERRAQDRVLRQFEPRSSKEQKKAPELRKTVTQANLRRAFSMAKPNVHPRQQIKDEEDDELIIAASGFLASGTTGYIAASGGSVSITSNTGTTSTGAHFMRSKLPPSIVQRMNQQVTTSLKVSGKAKAVTIEKNVGISNPTLKRCKSTNTIKLPKREEGSKPGYCESCRMKFPDFAEHVLSKKHIKFASDPANYAALDVVLDRLKRRRLSDMDEARVRRTAYINGEHHDEDMEIR